MDAKAFWGEVAKARATLPDTSTVFLMSLDCVSPRSVGGVVVDVPTEKAGEFITLKTHRLATKAEIAQHHEENERARRAISDAEYRRKQHFSLPQELNDLIAAAVGAAKDKPKGKAE